MNDDKKKMIDALNKVFVPHLRKRNFKGSFPDFRKIEGDFTSLLSFQFDTNGGGFIIELAIFQGVEFKTSWNEVVPLNKLTAQDLDFKERMRIYPDPFQASNGTADWFRYDRKSFWLFGNQFERLAKKVVAKIPLMERIWIG